MSAHWYTNGIDDDTIPGRLINATADETGQVSRKSKEQDKGPSKRKWEKRKTLCASIGMSCPDPSVDYLVYIIAFGCRVMLSR